jgi:hypothetical protein
LEKDNPSSFIGQRVLFLIATQYYRRGLKSPGKAIHHFANAVIGNSHTTSGKAGGLKP